MILSEENAPSSGAWFVHPLSRYKRVKLISQHKQEKSIFPQVVGKAPNQSPRPWALTMCEDLVGVLKTCSEMQLSLLFFEKCNACRSRHYAFFKAPGLCGGKTTPNKAPSNYTTKLRQNLYIVHSPLCYMTMLGVGLLSIFTTFLFFRVLSEVTFCLSK
jgi:hypothetical protein